MFNIINNILVKYINENSITEVAIPDGVTSIDDDAFLSCHSLRSVTIPKSVINIGAYAFYHCSNLTSINIPDSVTSIRRGAFEGCNSLMSIIIPKSVTSIGDYAFFYCTNLTSITIPDSVTNIRRGAFEGCKNLISKKAHYKAFNITELGITCRDYTFELNKWTKVIQNPELCKRGYHFCDNLFKVFNYYSGEIDTDIAIYECEVGDVVISAENNEKYVTNKIKPVKRLSKKNIIDILNNI